MGGFSAEGNGLQGYLEMGRIFCSSSEVRKEECGPRTARPIKRVGSWSYSYVKPDLLI
jgi:hypothetical protein